jgi:hypothetical protein
MRKFLIALALAAIPVTVTAQPSAPARAPAATPTPAPPKFDENTPLGILMEDRPARRVLETHWPVIVEAVELGGVPVTRTMKEAAASESARSRGGLTDEIYAKIIADLAKL